MRWTERAGLAMLGLVVAAAPLAADVRTEQKTKVEFGGALGKVVNIFGGKAAREGVVQTIAVSGDRKMTVTDRTGQLVDLAEEKIYDIDFKGKSYKVTTFAELRRRMEEAQAKAKEEMEDHEDGEPAEPQKKMEIDVVSKETGERKTVNGFDARQVVTTITVREEGRTIEESGGMVLTSDAWLTDGAAAVKEIEQFDRRYFEKLAGTAGATEQMAAALAMYPALKDALGRMRVEGATLEGTPVSTVLTVEGVKSPEHVKQEAQAEEDSGGRGLGGFLARKIARKKTDAGDRSRSAIMTMSTEVLSVSASVPPDGVTIPAGFKLKK